MALNAHILKCLNMENAKALIEPSMDDLCDALEEDSVLFIAAENPIGLRYLNGSKYLLDGSYASEFDNGLMTKQEWIAFILQAFAKCGLDRDEDNIRFFYPYPDYEITSEIFTDESVDFMGYGKTGYNFWDMKIDLYNENVLASKLSKEGMMSSLANSFLIMLSPSKAPLDFYYGKLSDNRDKRFAIGTRIVYRGVDKVVEKFPLYEAARMHIQELEKKAFEFSENSSIQVLTPFSVNSGVASYEFINAPTLKNLIKKSDNPCELIYEFYDLLFEQENRYKNLDLIFDNVFVDSGEFIIIDGEWIFEKELPNEFIIWIGINDLNMPEVTKEVHKHYGISEEDDAKYRQWADQFAREYVGCAEAEKRVKYLHKVPFKDIADGVAKYDAGARLEEPAKRSFAGRVIHKLTSKT